MPETTVIVCADCLRASCWKGEFMCETSRFASIKYMYRADLEDLGLEDPGFWVEEEKQCQR